MDFSSRMTSEVFHTTIRRVYFSGFLGSMLTGLGMLPSFVNMSTHMCTAPYGGVCAANTCMYMYLHAITSGYIINYHYITITTTSGLHRQLPGKSPAAWGSPVSSFRCALAQSLAVGECGGPVSVPRHPSLGAGLCLALCRGGHTHFIDTSICEVST